MLLRRRGLMTGLLAMPAIVHHTNLMKLSPMDYEALGYAVLYTVKQVCHFPPAYVVTDAKWIPPSDQWGFPPGFSLSIF